MGVKDLIQICGVLKIAELELANTGSEVSEIQTALQTAQQNVIDAQDNIKKALTFKEE